MMYNSPALTKLRDMYMYIHLQPQLYELYSLDIPAAPITRYTVNNHFHLSPFIYLLFKRFIKRKDDSIALLSHFDYFPNSFIKTFGTISLLFAFQSSRILFY